MAGEYTLTAEEEQYARELAGASMYGSGMNSMSTQKGNYINVYQKAKADILAKRGGGTGGAGGAGGGASGNLASSSSSNSSSFSGIEDADMRAALKDLINQMNAGGTAGQREAKAAKDASISKIDSLMGDYSKKSAFQDAADLMALNLSKSMEANKPAIQKAVEGSGTSAGSMQALLSQKLATESAQQAGAMGAEQAKAYGQILTALTGQRGNLTNGVDQTLDPMMKAMDLLKVQRQQSQQNSTGYFSPQQMSVESLSDKLALIAAQNTGALERTQLQADVQSAGQASSAQTAQAQIDAQLQAAAMQQRTAFATSPVYNTPIRSTPLATLAQQSASAAAPQAAAGTPSYSTPIQDIKVTKTSAPSSTPAYKAPATTNTTSSSSGYNGALSSTYQNYLNSQQYKDNQEEQ